ncbi:MAG TPA: ABC transporter permease subunit [Thermoplasmata archaeon]|nr:ABC transporter permease subunit [Thermoplasmata archaeon]
MTGGVVRTPPSVPARPPWSRVGLYVLAGGAGFGLPVLVGGSVAGFHGVTVDLPTAAVDVLLSLVRMVSAYLLSLGFSLLYGYVAATNRVGERVLIPILDILQSVPILGFFPIALVVLVGLTPHSWIGPNLASIFLIFTSMSWNMVFGVYESLKSFPADLRESADSFGVHGLQRIRQVVFPATVNRLVYNSVLSWTAGWYFLVLAEIFSTGANGVSLPGIGSYLATAAVDKDGNAFLAGFIILISVIAMMDFLVWRPLGRRAEKYRYDTSPSGESTEPGTPFGPRPLRRAAGYVARGVVTSVTRLGAPIATFASRTAGAAPKPGPRTVSAARYVAIGAVLVIGWLLLIFLSVGVFGVVTGPVTPAARHAIATVPFALGASAVRLLAAYAISVSIALPLAVFLVGRPKAYRVGLPIVEVVASFPATALFPVFIVALIPYFGYEGVSILMIITGMEWYLFFNILSGVRGIPPDLDEAARAFGLSRWQYYKRLLLPAILPAFITGSITAFGGGWNTLIVAEYFVLPNGSKFEVPGIGRLIDKGNAAGSAGLPLMVAALFAMVITVVAVNELFWKPRYRLAVEKYRID